MTLSTELLFLLDVECVRKTGSTLTGFTYARRGHEVEIMSLTQDREKWNAVNSLLQQIEGWHVSDIKQLAHLRREYQRTGYGEEILLPSPEPTATVDEPK